jgi:L-asparaginase/Glu-tRNA(Gln) amidotransferase subunit D
VSAPGGQGHRVKQHVYTYFGADPNMLEDYVADLVRRGAVIDALGIGYGPSPAKVAGLPHGGETWTAMVVARWPRGIDADAR